MIKNMSKQVFIWIKKCIWYSGAMMIVEKEKKWRTAWREWRLLHFEFQSSGPSSVTSTSCVHMSMCLWECALKCLWDGGCLLPFADLKPSSIKWGTGLSKWHLESSLHLDCIFIWLNMRVWNHFHSTAFGIYRLEVYWCIPTLRTFYFVYLNHK